jgi:hypothetical protein
MRQTFGFTAYITSDCDAIFAFNGPATSTDLKVAFDDFRVTNDRPRRHPGQERWTADRRAE